MTKKIDLNMSVYALTQEYPELISIMANLGFSEITNKAMLHSVGKIMTIPKGAKMKNIPMTDIVMTLVGQGFELVGDMPAMAAAGELKSKAEAGDKPTNSRTDQLKGYLKRLGQGEALETVRADFAREFGEVEAAEIMQAEQELLEEGTPLTEVQKLCDVHAALFHGVTKEDRKVNADVLEMVIGHPLYTLTKENRALSKLLAEYKEGREDLLPEIRQLSSHYAKKGDLLYPLLKVKYGISGPSDVMWTVDDEIRDELGRLSAEGDHDETWKDRMDAVLTRAEEMVDKEQNILFPICAANFTNEEWVGIYQDSKDYAVCFGVEKETWEAAEKEEVPMATGGEGEVIMPGGHLTVAQLTALLNTIPMEISFVDADNINRFFNEGPKVFKRPVMAIDRDVFSCHPPKIEPMVRKIIEDFRNKRRDEVSVWMEKGGRTMLVKYMAVRDREGEYLGTVELVQDMEFAKDHFLGNEG
ncbi:DUF438 domain-containing protein [Kallipyga massiliensis]|uniref:DUF438 domain-containing protein n=1 Tax=Kallipyga massiliensis TaxID=1472764 RepID=UPI0026E9A818|nr:DUF438 domain-containing protein [Kallipyga massiliensis]